MFSGYIALVQPSPLRVTILGLNYAPEPTGNAPYTTSLAEELAARGHTVRVITAHPHYPEWTIADGYGEWTKQAVHNGVTVVRLRHYVPKNPSNLRRFVSEASFGLRLLFAKWGTPDLLVVVSPALVASAVAAARIRIAHRSIPHVAWVQDIYTLGITETGSGGRGIAEVMARLESWTLRHATGVAVIHGRFREFVRDSLSVPEDRVEIVRNWSHLPPAQEFDREAIRKRLGWSSGETVVLHAGNQGIKQGLENVVEAARLADQQEAPVRFVLLGDGNQRGRLESLARGVRRIEFIDPLPGVEYQKVMASSDVLLVNERPGVSEMAVPSKLTSYFSTGVPVIAATDANGVTAGEISASHGGLRVEPGRPMELLRGVLELRGDRARAAALGAAGVHYRTEVLGQTGAIDHFEQWLYQNVSGDVASRPRDGNTTHAKV